MDFIVPGLEWWFAYLWPSFPSQNRSCVNALIAACANEDGGREMAPFGLSILKASLRQSAESYRGEGTATLKPGDGEGGARCPFLGAIYIAGAIYARAERRTDL